jgi:hypothetical protein
MVITKSLELRGEGNAIYPIVDRNPLEDPHTAYNVFTLGKKT